MDESLPKGLLEHLSPGEEIIDTLKTMTLVTRPDYTVITNQRILYFNEKHLGRYDMKVIPYSKLQKVHAEKGRLMYGSIILTDESGDLVELTRVPKDEIQPFIDKLEAAINRIAIEPVSINRNRRILGKMIWEFDKPPEMLFRTIPTGSPPPPPPGDMNCARCGGKLTYISDYNRWYCYNCKEYQ